MTSATATRERGVIFSAAEVRATIAGRKTQFRRPVKPQPVLVNDGRTWDWPKPSPYKPNRERGISAASWANGLKNPGVMLDRFSPFGRSGDRLWLRETWMPAFCLELDNLMAPCIGWEEVIHGPLQAGAEGLCLFYGADYQQGSGKREWPRLESDDESKWRSPVHMPRWASRLTLEIVSVRVERARDIGEEEARAEGAEHWIVGHGPVIPSDGEWSHRGYREGFAHLWDATYSKKRFGLETDPWAWAVEYRPVEAVNA